MGPSNEQPHPTAVVCAWCRLRRARGPWDLPAAIANDTIFVARRIRLCPQFASRPRLSDQSPNAWATGNSLAAPRRDYDPHQVGCHRLYCTGFRCQPGPGGTGHRAGDPGRRPHRGWHVPLDPAHAAQDLIAKEAVKGACSSSHARPGANEIRLVWTRLRLR